MCRLSAVSLTWRVLKVCQEDVVIEYPEYSLDISLALATWGEFILGEASSPGTLSHHMFIIATTPGQAFCDASNDFCAYNLKSTDGVVFRDPQFGLMVFAKLPSFVFVAAVVTLEITEPGWIDHRINPFGKVPTIQRIPRELKEFLIERGERAVADTRA